MAPQERHPLGASVLKQNNRRKEFSFCDGPHGQDGVKLIDKLSRLYQTSINSKMWLKAFRLLKSGMTTRNSISVVPAFVKRWTPDDYVTRSKADEAHQHHGRRVAIIGAGPCGLVAFILLSNLGVSGCCKFVSDYFPLGQCYFFFFFTCH